LSGTSWPSTIAVHSPATTRKSSWVSSEWYIVLRSPGSIVWRLIPKSGNQCGLSGSKFVERPQPGAALQTDSVALRTNQPSLTGRLPAGVSSSSASRGTVGRSWGVIDAA
jgi:hypothetical protein